MSVPPSPPSSPERIMAVNHHLRLALDAVQDGVMVVESGPLTAPGPAILYANGAMSRMTGVPAGSLCGVPLGALSDGKVLLELLAAAMEAPAESAAPLNHREGPALTCRWKAVPVAGASGLPLNFILTATALAATAPGEPAAAPDSLRPCDPAPPRPEMYQQDLVETIRDTARFVAHEFNNALTAILVPVQVAIRQVPDGGDLHGKLQVAFESARRAADLAKDFLDCFRPRAAVRERCRLDSLLGRAMRLATCAQNVNWSLEVADDLREAEIDLNQMERVIFNLVRNACQAMPNGGQILVKAANTEIGAADEMALPPGPYVSISVRDWGPGIPEAHLPHLFHSCFTTKENGNGCGLPICYQIVKDHGGDMYVRSRPNVGTAFLIFLPAAGAAAPPAAPRGLAPLVPRPVVPEPPAAAGPPVWQEAVPGPSRAVFPGEAGAGPSMLVIDDEDGVRRALEQIGKVYGFEVVTAATSEEGLQSYRDRLHARRRYDTVLLDLNLRGSLNGAEVLEVIRRIDPEATVIGTSGQYSERDLIRFRELGFAGFLPKPFTLEDFDRVVQEVCGPAGARGLSPVR